MAKGKDTLPIKEKELHILINLLHTDVFFVSTGTGLSEQSYIYLNL